MWNSFDASGNGSLTLGEVESGLYALLQVSGKGPAPGLTRGSHAYLGARTLPLPTP